MRQGYAKPWKVNFAEDRRVANKSSGGAAHAIRKVRPAGDTRQIKEQRRHTVRGKFSHMPKDDSEDERGEERLDDVPERAQNRLFVLRYEIAPHEHSRQISIPPQITQMQIEPSGLWPNDQVPPLSGCLSFNGPVHNAPRVRLQAGSGRKPAMSVLTAIAKNGKIDVM